MKVKYDPWRFLIIKEAREYATIDEMVKTEFAISLANAETTVAGFLRWTSGYAIANTFLDLMSQKTIEEAMEQGIIYWTYMAYSPMPNYRDFIEVNGKRVQFIDVSGSEIFSEVVIQIKKSIFKKKVSAKVDEK